MVTLESTQSWREVLGQLKRLGLTSAPKLAIGDGSLGFWIALQEEYGSVAQQRCWVEQIRAPIADLCWASFRVRKGAS